MIWLMQWMECQDFKSLENDSKITLSKGDDEMAKAGGNERLFKEWFKENYDKKYLCGKERFTDSETSVNISVDESIQHNNHNVIIEIDSGNYAKLLVGQYVLLNELLERNIKFKEKKENTVFLVIHYFKDYNIERTQKNLELVNNNIYKGEGIKFYVLHKNQLNNIAEEYPTIEELINLFKG